MAMQVQGTNDNSIVSKLSSSKQGYFEDDFLKLFVAREQRRSPIINRGYYIRFKAIEAVFNAWFSIVSSHNLGKVQVVSLGAGFDTSYFRLKSLNQLPNGCRYIEIDYPEVMHRKLDCINKSKFLTSNLCASKDSKIVFNSEEYVMIGHDLGNYGEIKNIFNEIGITFSCPTLFLSECAVTYMPVESSNGLIQWIQRNFPNSTFVAYEQIQPNDGFGIIMQNHFTSLQCSLKSICMYPDEEKQSSRYKEFGWESCLSTTMFDFFMALPDEEKNRIQDLELFDEYEMWHEKCHHYILIWACQGISMSLPGPKVFPRKRTVIDNFKGTYDSAIKWQLEESHSLLHRFGHQAILLSQHLLLLSGGFGHVDKKHQRLGGLVICNLLNNKCSYASLLDPEDHLGKRMFHSFTKLSNGDIVVIGGRSSPIKVYDKVIVIKSANVQHPHEENLNIPGHEPSFDKSLAIASFSAELETVMPVPLWRHSASLVEISGSESIIVFGGCALSKKETNENSILNDCHILSSATWNWSTVSCQEHTPSPRHSHSSVTYERQKIIVTGGLSKNETILNSVHIFDAEKVLWSTLVISGLFPRYSHTSHISNDKVLLVGGITRQSGFSLSIGIIQLATFTALECSAPAQDPEYPILLNNHCSYIHENCIIVTGGGGNCFSFGTHFNRKSVRVDINNLPL